jgi:hypothetical protein
VLLLGLSLYLTYDTAGFLLAPNGPNTAAAVACTAAALAPWLGSRTATTTLAIPAGALTAYVVLTQHDLLSIALADLVPPLIALWALAALSGGPARLPRSWAWLPCLAPAAAALAAVHHPVTLAGLLFADSQLLLAVVTVGWLIVDARPAFAFCLAQLVSTLLFSLCLFTLPGQPQSLLGFYLVELTVIGAITLAVGWLFRRQTGALRVRPRS